MWRSVLTPPVFPWLGGKSVASHSGRASAVRWEWLFAEGAVGVGRGWFTPRGSAWRDWDLDMLSRNWVWAPVCTWTTFLPLWNGDRPSHSFGKDQMGRCVDGVCHEIVLYMPLKLVVKVARALRLPSPAMMAHFSHFSMWAEALVVPGYPGLPVFWLFESGSTDKREARPPQTCLQWWPLDDRVLEAESLRAASPVLVPCPPCILAFCYKKN